ncbi:programmed cell death 1 [Pelobates cultripes]|uniref:Programmed cell death 1 n=1 Tax=Pelobates cultripes TaxID=61616 RepID=A0AAD1RCB7_PELCU|nr:programmed cell death 1 [Pelobates cultripes]
MLGLSYADEEITLTHFPSDIFINPGATVTFTCNVSSLNYTIRDINWYKTINNESKKIADLSNPENGRICISANWNLSKAEIFIKNVTMNDSGEYHCEHVDVNGDKKVSKSRRSKLNVTDGIIPESSLTTPSKKNSNKKPKSNTNITIILVSIILTLLLLFFICIALVLWKQKADQIPDAYLINLEVFRKAVQRTEYVPLLRMQNEESPTQSPTVYTVDYGVLEFSNKPYRKSAELCVTEQVEHSAAPKCPPPPRVPPVMGGGSKR